MFLRFAFLLFAIKFQMTTACGAGGVGGFSDEDNRIVQNPTFSMEINPPVAWTYPENNAQASYSYFPGQRLSQAEANIQAHSDLEAAVLSAVVESGIPTQGVVVRSTYTAPEISDCKKAGTVTTMAGQRIGVVESGAVVKTITPTAAAISVQDCMSRAFLTSTTVAVSEEDYTVQTTVQIEGITGSKFQMRQIARQMMAILNFKYNARFVAEIQIQ
uniref:DUF4468 domain-containing protein n=1 Tax=Steinernema glaseri TaxID=37863 RepID=A0A1I7YI37_9BILA